MSVVSCWHCLVVLAELLCLARVRVGSHRSKFKRSTAVELGSTTIFDFPGPMTGPAFSLLASITRQELFDASRRHDLPSGGWPTWPWRSTGRALRLGAGRKCPGRDCAILCRPAEAVIDARAAAEIWQFGMEPGKSLNDAEHGTCGKVPRTTRPGTATTSELANGRANSG